MKSDRSFPHMPLRLSLAVLAAAAALSMAACTQKEDSPNAGGDATTAASQTDTTTAVTTTLATTAATTVPPVTGDLTTGWSTDSVNIRTGPGIEYYAIGGLHVGEQVTILGKEGDWYKIRFVNGPDGVGYVNAQYISGSLVPTATTAATTTAPAATTTAAAAQ